MNQNTMSEDDELNTLDKILHWLKMDDISVFYANGVFYAEDDTPFVMGHEEFYRFLIDDCFVWEGDAAVGIPKKLLDRFLEYAWFYNFIGR